jgi:HSP20 family protein
MAIVQWNGLKDIEDLFDRYARGWSLRSAGEQAAAASWTPRVDIAETPEEFSIKVEIPEVGKDDVRITVDNGVLTIAGERKQGKVEDGKSFHRIERFYGSFSRSFSLPENADGSATKAGFKDGMLTVRIPKLEQSKPKSVEVQIE